LEIAPPDDPVVDDWQTGVAEDDFHHRLVHAERRAQDTRTDVRDVGQFQETLQRALLATHAVHDREDHVEPSQGRRSARPPPARMPPRDEPGRLERSFLGRFTSRSPSRAPRQPASTRPAAPARRPAWRRAAPRARASPGDPPAWDRWPTGTPPPDVRYGVSRG